MSLPVSHGRNPQLHDLPTAELDNHLGSFHCPICLDDCPATEESAVLRCNHHVCRDCLQRLWTHNILSDSEPFPRCPMPYCPAYASEASLSALVSPHVAKRMRQLRGLKPARAADGRRMYCISEGCYEQLPPPPPVEPPPQEHRNSREQGEENDEEQDENLISTCPECTQSVCTRCGCAQHSGKPCAVPLICRRQRRMYNTYAVGRIMSCPRCGIHIERDGGCDRVQCPRCKNHFSFKPFRTPEEAEEAIPVEDVTPIEPMTLAILGFQNAASVFSLLFFLIVWGAGLSSFSVLFVRLEVRAVVAGDFFAWPYLVLIPIFCIGLPIYVSSCVSFLLGCTQLFGHIGERDQMANAFRCLILSSIVIIGQHGVWQLCADSAMWVWITYFLPVLLCGSFLFVISLSHILVVVVMKASRRYRRWKRLPEQSDPEMDEVDVENEDREGEADEEPRNNSTHPSFLEV